MIEISRMLCPIDFSDCSHRALRCANAIAAWYSARLTVLHTFPTAVPSAALALSSPLIEPISLSLEDRRALVAELERFAASERVLGVNTDVQLTEGSAWREIVAAAAALDAHLLVMGTHGRAGFERFMLGSVTEKVLRAAPCPVLTVPPAVADTRPVAGQFRHIVCAVDFSPPSLNALTWAMSLAQEADAELTVLHVSEAPWDPGTSAPAMAHAAEFQRSHEEEQVRRHLRDAVPGAVRTYCHVSELTLRGTPHRAILKAAGELNAELIVMGVQGRGALGLAFFGSTTQQVVRAAACPVLTVRRRTEAVSGPHRASRDPGRA